jgi:hypothetical protein
MLYFFFPFTTFHKRAMLFSTLYNRLLIKEKTGIFWLNGDGLNFLNSFCSSEKGYISSD